MKPEDIFNAITDIRDDQINFPKPRRSRAWYLAPIAACLALALIALPFLGARSPWARPLYTGAAQLAAASYPEPSPGDELPAPRAESGQSSYAAGPFSEEDSGEFTVPERFLLQSAEIFLTADNQQNLIFSPVSLYTILGMSAELCEGEARQEILDLLLSPGIEALRDSSRSLWSRSYADGDSAFILANSLWLSNAVDYKQPVLDLLAENYFADSFRGDMGSAEYDRMHLDWLDDRTNGYLTDRLPELNTPKDTVIYLDSTLYYKAGWLTEFDPSQNIDGTFHAMYMDQDCTFMRESFQGLYYRGESFAAVSKPLYGGQEMLFVLPGEGVTTNELLVGGEYQRFMDLVFLGAGWSKEAGCANINLSVPKFDITSSADMTLGLKSMGINGIFESGKGSFSPLTDQDFAFTSVTHTCRLSIDEQGCEGAAVTTMRGDGGAAPPEETVDFTLDRPFLFAILSESGLPVFMGAVNRMAE